MGVVQPAERNAVLEMRHVSKGFAGVKALNHVSFSAYAGEVVALIGENGAGKSTLMKVLGGVYQPDAGEILIDGVQVKIGVVSDAIHHGIAFIHQELNVLDNIDVAGNVFLGREPLRGGPLRLIDRSKMRAQTQPYLDQLGLNIPADTSIANLSIAQRQLVEIAKALSLNARVLIMDEPTSSLTLTETSRLIDVVKNLRTNGVSIIYISHRLGEIVGFADRVVALRDGENAGEISGDKVDHDTMVRMMVGRDIDRASASDQSRDLTVRLSAKNLRTRRYPSCEVSFDVRKGEILGIAGLVGAGRSELVQAIFGVDPLVAGSVGLDGEPVDIRSARDAIDHGIYLAPEDRRRCGVIVEMAIRENVTLPSMDRCSRNGIILRSKEADTAREAITSLHIKAPSISTAVQNLSGGNQQKVVLAKWMALGPKVLIFDEPTRGIDVGAKAEIYGLMRALAQTGVAILMVSSDMEEVLRLSDRIAVMHEGRLTGVLDRSEASEEAVMQLAVGSLKASA